MTDQRPACIVNQADIRQADDAHYPNSKELLSIGSPFSDRLGLTRIGIHHELLPPGRRTSYPHAESDEEEFVYVIEGTPDVWLDGQLYPLKPGDGVGFPAGTGLSHTFINNSKEDVRLLVVGERNKKSNRILYPMNPERIAECGTSYWHDAPKRPLGPHNGKPN